MNDFIYKLDTNLIPKISEIKNIKILELGVENGRSTKKFLELCEKNGGKLYSVDKENCSKISSSPNWKFIQSMDDNFDLIKNNITSPLDVIFIDTTHEADHVEKIIYGYYDILKINGYLFIDDVSHLPYIKSSNRENFYCEINNKETFYRILEIYHSNINNFDLEFSFISSGLAIIKKKTDIGLFPKAKIFSKESSLKNILRKIWKSTKKN